MLKIAALVLASAGILGSAAALAATPSPALVSNAPWWEKVTVTITGDGQPQSCRYESSLAPSGAQSCEVSGSAAASGESASKDQFTRITFERRFSPGGEPDSGALQTGDTLLGRQVMALAIDAAGAVKHCNVVASGGAMTPDYGCAEARGERFKASAERSPSGARQAYMTVLVYGHAEHVV